MRHTWGPIRYIRRAEHGAAIPTAYCARCGLRKLKFENVDSRTGWSTRYLGEEKYFTKAPPCVDSTVPIVGQVASTNGSDT